MLLPNLRPLELARPLPERHPQSTGIETRCLSVGEDRGLLVVGALVLLLRFLKASEQRREHLGLGTQRMIALCLLNSRVHLLRCAALVLITLNGLPRLVIRGAVPGLGLLARLDLG